MSDRLRINAMFLLVFLVSTVFATSTARATVPAELVELTRAEMTSRGFKFKIDTHGDRAEISVTFPKQLLMGGTWLVPVYTGVVVKDRAGNDIASTLNWVAGNDALTIVSSYQPKLTDLSVSIDYGCPMANGPGFGCGKIFRISSVSKFFDENPDAVNLPLNCKKVSFSKLEILDCTGENQ